MLPLFLFQNVEVDEIAVMDDNRFRSAVHGVTFVGMCGDNEDDFRWESLFLGKGSAKRGMALALSTAFIHFAVDLVVFKEFTDVMKKGASDEVIGIEFVVACSRDSPGKLRDTSRVINEASTVGDEKGEGDVFEMFPPAFLLSGSPDTAYFVSESLVLDKGEFRKDAVKVLRWCHKCSVASCPMLVFFGVTAWKVLKGMAQGSQGGRVRVVLEDFNTKTGHNRIVRNSINWWDAFMPRRLRTLDVLIVMGLLVASTAFLYKAEYLAPFFPTSHPPASPVDVNITTPVETPPTSLFPASRRDVTGVDEGMHFDALSVSREWWYYTAVFNGTDLDGWSATIGFAHLAPGDLLGTTKPDLLAVALLDPAGDHYGGMINKRHYLGVLKSGTLIADTPGVKLTYDTSWAEGTAPTWHVHGETTEIDSSHVVVLDLNYQARALPVWTLGSKAFVLSNSTLACYLFLDCDISGTISIDGVSHTVHGVGTYEHAWSPNVVTRAEINGWDWLTLHLDNGWMLYASYYLPVPQALTEKSPKLPSFGTTLLTTDHGETITELKNLKITVTSQDDKLFPLVKMPSAFDLSATPSMNPSYLVSQSLLYGTSLSLALNGTLTNSVGTTWKFPTYVGMNLGLVHVTGDLSWTDSTGQHDVPFTATGTTWDMRALL